MKKRILAQINTDFNLSLFDFLNHSLKCHVFDPEDSQTSAELIDISGEFLLLKYTHPFYTNPQYIQLPITPPMSDNSLQEAEQAFKEMARTKAEARQLAPFQITTFLPLGCGKHVFKDLAIFAILNTISIPVLRSALWSSIFNRILRLADRATSSRNVKRLVFVRNMLAKVLGKWGLLIILGSANIVQALTVMNSKTRQYRVPGPQRYWWILATLVEGFPAISRFNGLITDREEAY